MKNSWRKSIFKKLRKQILYKMFPGFLLKSVNTFGRLIFTNEILITKKEDPKWNLLSLNKIFGLLETNSCSEAYSLHYFLTSFNFSAAI